MEITERTVLNFLYRKLTGKNHELIAPNVRVWKWESDMISATRAGYLNEYEVKLTKKDFRADKNKTFKYDVEDLEGTPEYVEEGPNYRRGPDMNIYDKRTLLRHYPKGPSYFWYVIPKTLFKELEEHVPEDFGIMTFRVGTYYGTDKERLYISEKRRPSRLNKKKMSDGVRDKVLTSFFYRYWRIRNKGIQNTQELTNLRREAKNLRRTRKQTRERNNEYHKRWSEARRKFDDILSKVDPEDEHLLGELEELKEMINVYNL